MATNSISSPPGGESISSYPASYLAQDRSPEIYATHTILFVLAVLAVVARFYTALRVAKRALDLHDWLALAAGVGTIGVYACSMLWLRFGLGRHAAWARAQDRDNIRRFLQTIMANEMLYTTTLACARLSIVVFYYRIFGLTNMRYWLHFVVGFIAAWSLCSYVPSIFACWPISDFWNQEGDMHNCINLYILYTGVAIGSIITDFLLMVLPLPYICTLRTTVWRKILTCLLFVLGGLNCFITMIRLFIVLGVDLSDPTYNTVDLMIWTGLELYTATLCCCLPALPPLLRYVCQRWGLNSLFSHSSGSSNKGSIKSIGGISDTMRSTWRKNSLKKEGLTTFDDSLTEIELERQQRGRELGSISRPSYDSPTFRKPGFEPHESSLRHTEDLESQLRGYAPNLDLA